MSSGIRKKRAAPPPPIARPLSSAISSQALERIIDSEESLTSDIDISKSPSDIGASSKANSDIGVSSKANSDIGVHSLNSKQSSEIGYKIDSEFRAALAGHDEKTCEIDRHSAPAPPPSRSKLSIDIASESQVDRVITIEDPPGQCQKDNQNVETARVVAKRGKLVRSPGSIENNASAYSFISQNSHESLPKVSNAKNHTRSSKSPHNSPLNCPRSKSNSELTASLIGSQRNYNETTGRLQKSQSLVYRPKFVAKPNIVASLEAIGENIPLRSCENREKLEKFATIGNLREIDCVTGCGLLESRYSPSKPHCDNYICDERCKRKILQHSLSFQNKNFLRETKIVSSFENSKAIAMSQSFSRINCEKAPKLGDFTATNFYAQPLISSYQRDSGEDFYDEKNLSPPPLSNLQIFAISTKPVDIQVTQVDEIPGDIDKLPSLPILSRSGSKVGAERKVSILEPPPPGLVSRQESNENWSQFLDQLNSILESRVGEFV